MSDKTYNGWTNYETWAVNLWLTNEEPIYSYWCDVTREAITEAPLDDRVPEIWNENEAAKFNLADRMKAELEESAPEIDGMWADLLNAALSEVDFHEIAASFLDTVRENA